MGSNGQEMTLTRQTCLKGAAMQEQLQNDVALTVVCNLSQAMGLNSTLDGHPPGFIHLHTKAETAINGMFDHYQCCGEHLLVAATIRRNPSPSVEPVRYILTAGDSFS